MKHYQHPTTGELYAYEEDGSQDAIIPADFVPVTQAQADAIRAAMVPPPGVPQVVTARQAWQALIMAGLIDQVQPAIDAIADPVQRRLLDAEWNKSQEFHRTRPALIALATAIGLTSQDLDNLFTQAAQL